ncbi:alpha 1,2 mannosyltransferase [Coelomomyces lativittatus]|nr:alpha 1,2 mannosyltransferase [Coelomomyces lativittatus]
MVFIKRRWTLLVLSRFLIGFIPCYLHPDEFFQNPEVAAAYVLNNNAELPWEFHPEYPMRSMLPM